MKKIFVSYNLPGLFDEGLSKKYAVEIREGEDLISREELLRKIAGVHGVVTLLTDIVDAEFFEAAGGQLEVVANYAVGYDNIDVAEATKRGVAVTNTPGVLTEAVGEHVIALLLAVSRRVVEGDQHVRAGKYHGWRPNLLVGSTIRGKTMGIIGLGRIGKWTARLACGLGMKTMYYSRTQDMEFELECGLEYTSFEDVLKRADVVSLNVPLTKETSGLMSGPQFALMKKTAILINTARGGVVDEKALIAALKQGVIGGAGLDVFEDERNVNPDLYSLTNVVLTPHIASATQEAREAMARIAVEGVESLLSGSRPANVVNPEIWKGGGDKND